MIAEYNILNFDLDQTIATAVVDISADESEYGILLAIEEGRKAAEKYLYALLGELVIAEEASGYWPEMPHGDGWLHGPGIERPTAIRWADGFEPHG